jgi:hypothetical protein
MLESIRKIKSHSEPPWDKHDIYYMRYPWQKFGGVSSGVCMGWCWYRDDVILRNVSQEDIDEALKQLGYKNER